MEGRAIKWEDAKEAKERIRNKMGKSGRSKGANAMVSRGGKAEIAKTISSFLGAEEAHCGIRKYKEETYMLYSGCEEDDEFRG